MRLSQARARELSRSHADFNWIIARRNGSERINA